MTTPSDATALAPCMTDDQVNAIAILLTACSGRPAQMTLDQATQLVRQTLVEAPQSPFRRRSEPTATAGGWMPETLAVLRAVHAELDKGDGNGPGHAHWRKGIWDDDNKPELAGKPCEWCATWAKFTALVDAPPSGEKGEGR